MTDHTAGVGNYGPGKSSGLGDLLTDLSHGDELRLLKLNNIDLTKTGEHGRGTMQALVVDSTLEPAGHPSVQFSKLTLSTPAVNEKLNVSYSHDEFTSHLQRQIVGAASSGFGIPGLFKFETSYHDASATSTHDKEVQIHFQASQTISKARVVFEEADIVLAPGFVAEIERACASGADAVANLLHVLGQHGHLVPMSTVPGGRISLLESTELTQRSEFEAVRRKFQAAVDARFAVDGFPVDAGGGGGASSETIRTSTLSEQAKSLSMELRGGDEALSSSKPGTWGTRWKSSVKPYAAWRPIGYTEKSLMPILDSYRPRTGVGCARGAPICSGSISCASWMVEAKAASSAT